ncbi:MAG: 4-hydroxy-tetrahydrodipicolinate synthase, partial [Pseudomonadota bacterium]
MSLNINDFPLWTAIVTPLLENGEVDYPTLENLLRKQESARNGVVVLGSTGEALNLNPDEKEKILNLALGLKLKIPLMAGVGGINLTETSAWVKYLNTLPLDAYMMVTPIYAKPGTEGQFHWFKSLMDIASKPVVVYNVPGRTAVALSVDALKRLSTHPRLWGLKEASGNIVDFKRYQEAAPNVRIFSGDDAMTPMFCANGAKGLISVASNVWPEATHKIVDLCLEKAFEESE